MLRDLAVKSKHLNQEKNQLLQQHAMVVADKNQCLRELHINGKLAYIEHLEKLKAEIQRQVDDVTLLDFQKDAETEQQLNLDGPHGYAASMRGRHRHGHKQRDGTPKHRAAQASISIKSSSLSKALGPLCVGVFEHAILMLYMILNLWGHLLQGFYVVRSRAPFLDKYFMLFALKTVDIGI